MSTAIKDAEIDLSAHEFSTPCAVKNCEDVATWAGWSRHGQQGCPGEAFVCDKHKESTIKWWTRVLVMAPPPRCVYCLEYAQGLVSDNVRFVPL